MRIVYVSRTHHSGVPERMARAVNEYTDHEARALVPGPWLEGKETFDAHLPHRDPLYDVNDRMQLDWCLEWADVIHCMYNCSVLSLGRAGIELDSNKLCVWHLATKWDNVFWRQFMVYSKTRTKFVVSAEGWDRYPLPGEITWHQLPVVFLLDHPFYRPISIEKRVRFASMSVRVKLDTTDDGKPIAAPRASKEVATALRGLEFRRFHGHDFKDCMIRKRKTWIGIDDVVNPLVHQSGFEYLSLGVPCVNRSDGHLREVVEKATGSSWWPFIEADLAGVRPVVERALAAERSEWRLRGQALRLWMENYMHPRDVIQRYIDVYEGARVTA